MFKGIEVLFFVLGVLSTLGVFALIKLNRKYAFPWHTWACTGTSLFLCIFTIAWSVSSIFEGEIQAAGLGIIFFGIPSLILGFLSRRMILQK